MIKKKFVKALFTHFYHNNIIQSIHSLPSYKVQSKTRLEVNVYIFFYEN